MLQRVAVTLVRKFDTHEADKPFVPWAIGFARFEVLRYRRDFATDRHHFDSDIDSQVSNVLSGSNSNEIWGAQWPEQFLCPSAPSTVNENAYKHRISYGFNSQVPGREYERAKIVDADKKYAYGRPAELAGQ